MMNEKTIATPEPARSPEEYVHLIPVAPLPDDAEFALGSQRLSRIGPIALYRAGWGTFVDSRQIAQAASQAGHPPDLTATIEQLGFSGGYHFPADTDTFSDYVQALHTQYVTRMVEQVLAAREWDATDALFIGSQTILEGAMDDIRAELRRHGKEVGQIYWYRLACNSATAALIDTLREPEFHGKRVAVVGLETLSGNSTDISNPVTYSTFGNGGSAIAYIPGREMQVLTGETVVEYDTNGFFHIPHQANRRPTSQSRGVPHDYRTVGEETEQHFYATEDGIYLEMPADDDFYMDGRGTFKYFTSTGVTDLIWNALQTYREKFSRQLGRLGVAIGHQPSMAVVDGLNRSLFRIAMTEHSEALERSGKGDEALSTRDIRKLMRSGLDERIASLRKIGIDAVSLHIPWVMDEVGFNNISAATALSALETLAAKGAVLPGTAHLLLGLGIGASYQAHIVRFGAEA
jgi:3-oxoacyl-[acyl-carrier-protein] synthase III